MATLVLTPDEFANGNLEQDPSGELGGILTVTGRPFVDYFESQSPPVDWSQAKVYVEIPDSAVIEGNDFDNDGNPDQVIQSGTPILSCTVDIDNDGTPDYRLESQNPGESIELNTQTGSNIGEMNGTFSIVDLDTNVSTPISGGNIFISTDGPFPETGEAKDIINEGSDELDIDGVVCFVRGTLIHAPDGPRNIEDLRVGDLILTVDHGPQPIRWIGRRKLGAWTVARQAELRPIRIRAGALAPGCPDRDLLVSPQHRILLGSNIIRGLLDTGEILVPAKKLLGLIGVEREPVRMIEYFHILLDRHEVIWANGTRTETMLTGPMALKTLGPDQFSEIALIFPELAMPNHVAKPARPIPERRQLAAVLNRHAETREPLCQPCDGG